MNKNNKPDVKGVRLQSESKLPLTPNLSSGSCCSRRAGGNSCRSLTLTHSFRWLRSRCTSCCGCTTVCVHVCCVLLSLCIFRSGEWVCTGTGRLEGTWKKKNKKRKCLWVTHLYVRDGRAWNWGFRAPPSAPTEAFSRKSPKMANYHGNAFVCAGDRVTGEQATNPEISLGQRKEGDGRRDGGRLGGRGRGDWRFQKQVIWVSLPVFPSEDSMIYHVQLPARWLLFPPNTPPSKKWMSLWISSNYH